MSQSNRAADNRPTFRRAATGLSILLACTFLPAQGRANGDPAAAPPDPLRSLAEWSPEPGLVDVTGFYPPTFFPTTNLAELRSRSLTLSGPLRDVIAGGIRNLPLLLSHLDDAAPTRVEIRHAFGGQLVEHYEPRLFATTPSVNEKPDHGWSQSYRLRVGDLCMFAVGQIVNRDLAPVRMHPTAVVNISSPLESPSLAKATRADWKGTTAAGHRASLERDCFRVPAGLQEGAIPRLGYYYPADCAKILERLFRLPIYSEGDADAFVGGTLVKESDPARWRALVTQFAHEHGVAGGNGLAPTLVRRYLLPDVYVTSSERSRAEAILAAIAPRLRCKEGVFTAAISDFQVCQILDRLRPVRTPAVRREVERLQARVHHPRADEDPSANWEEIDGKCSRYLTGS